MKKENTVLKQTEFGFRPKHSTVDAIATLTNDILHAINKKDYTISNFCDLSIRHSTQLTVKHFFLNSKGMGYLVVPKI